MEFIGLILFLLVPTIIFGPWIYTRVVEGRRRRDLASLRSEFDSLATKHDRLQQKVKELEARLAGGAAVADVPASPKPAETKPVSPTVPVPVPAAAPPQPVVAKPQEPAVKPPYPIIPVTPPTPQVPAAKSPAAQEPPKPAAPPATPTEPSPKPWDKPKPSVPVAPPPKIASPWVTPPSAQVRPPASPALTKSALPSAPPVSTPPPKKVSAAFEEMVGTNWLPKLGVVILFVGLVSWIASQWEQIPPAGRIGLFYVLGATMLGLGVWLEKKERYLVLGRALIGGGWAVTFFTTYAMHYVPAAKIISSMELDLLLMMLVTGVMVWHTLKYNSQAVTGLAFLLGFFSIAQSHESVFSLLAGVILAPGLVVIVQRRKWFELEVFGILATFLNHFYWLFPIIDPMQAQFGKNVYFKEFPVSVGVLLAYWIIFRASYVIRKIDDRQQETVSTIAALLNTFLLLGVLKYQSLHKEIAFFALLVLGAIELGLAQLPALQKRRTAFLVLATLGGCLIIGAAPFRYADDPSAMSVLWLIFAQAFFFSGIFAKEVVYRRFGIYTGMLVALYEMLMQGVPFMEHVIGGAQRHTDAHAGTLFVSTAAVFYMNAHWARRRWPDLFSAGSDDTSLSLLSYCAGIATLLATYMFVPQAWVAVTLAALVVIFTFAASKLELSEVFQQSHLFALIALADVVLSNADLNTWVRPFSFLAVAASLYLSSRFIRLSSTASEFNENIGIAYTWAASLMVGYLCWCQFRDYRTAVLWVVFALVLGVLGSRLKRNELNWQSLVLAILAFARAIVVNMEAPGDFHGASLRLLSVIFIAGMLYLLAKWSPQEDLTPAYSWGGTILLTILIYKECTNQLWIAPLLMLLALALCGAARYWKQRGLLWQCHALSILSMGNIFALNFDEAHRFSHVQLITVAFVIAAMYAISWLGRIAEILEDVRIPQVYAWAGSLLVTWLMWYQLPAISVAVAWAMFGVVLFEIGHESLSSSFRLQAYLALAASFVLIFFANLNHPSEAGKLNPRVYTVIPLALMYFYVYWRIHSKFDDASKDGKIKAETVLAYLGTGAIGALLRFEVTGDWVIAAWAAMFVGLLLVAKFSKERIFLQQALLLLIPFAFRTSMNNLYLSGDTRMLTVSVACGVLLLGLPIAYMLRQKDPANPSRGLAFLMDRPEQLTFFVPFALFTVLLAVQMPKGMWTLSWGVEGIVVFLLALFANERSFRLTGLALLMVCVAKVILWDVWNMNETRNRYLTLMGIGAILLVVSFLYGKYREKVRELL